MLNYLTNRLLLIPHSTFANNYEAPFFKYFFNIGELLFNNQLNEEITCSDSGCKEINKSIESSVELEEGLQFALILASSTTQLNYSNFQDSIPRHQVFDVPVPPPNC